MSDQQEPLYPFHPGFKAEGTSHDAARVIAPKAPTLRAKVKRLLSQRGAMTPDETAEAMGEDILSVRPRFSELKRLGEIERTGERRKNESGVAAYVFRVRPDNSAAA
jgi:hypothetical protein